MKFTASILFIYLVGLFLQPLLLPLPNKEKKEMSCCAKNKAHKNCSKNKGCCDNNQCNPFYSQCPLCAANATTVKKYTLPPSRPEFYTKQSFQLINTNLISHYQADILRPPQSV